MEKSTMNNTFYETMSNIFDINNGVRLEEIKEYFLNKWNTDQVSYAIYSELLISDISTCVSYPYSCSGLKESDPKKLSIIPFLFNGTAKHYFKCLCTKKEGVMCAGDKATFIIRRIKESLLTGENLSLFQTYFKEDLGGEKYKNMQAYWSPICLCDTNEAIESFLNWYYLL